MLRNKSLPSLKELNIRILAGVDLLRDIWQGGARNPHFADGLKGLFEHGCSAELKHHRVFLKPLTTKAFTAPRVIDWKTKPGYLLRVLRWQGKQGKTKEKMSDLVKRTANSHVYTSVFVSKTSDEMTDVDVWEIIRCDVDDISIWWLIS